jgi:sirohydrochlorin cobaltochelatase
LVIPLIINAAGHVKMEIPQAVAQAARAFPDVTFTITPQVGTGDELFAALKANASVRCAAWRCPIRRPQG